MGPGGPEGRRGRVGLLIRWWTEESAHLNQTYRGKAGPTNVLAFPFLPPPGTRNRLLGDTVICVPVVLEEATAQWQAPAPPLGPSGGARGIHLLGYDHMNGRRRRAWSAGNAGS